jgi:hypothetical protein
MFQFIQIGLGPHLIYQQLTAVFYRSNGKVHSKFQNIIAIIILPSDYHMKNNSSHLCWFLQGAVVGALTRNYRYYDASGNH